MCSEDRAGSAPDATLPLGDPLFTTASTLGGRVFVAPPELALPACSQVDCTPACESRSPNPTQVEGANARRLGCTNREELLCVCRAQYAHSSGNNSKHRRPHSTSINIYWCCCLLRLVVHCIGSRPNASRVIHDDTTAGVPCVGALLTRDRCSDCTHLQPPQPCHRLYQYCMTAPDAETQSDQLANATCITHF